MQDWVITIPKSADWEQYMAEVEHAEKNNESLFYRVPKPTKCAPGDRCFVVYDGEIRGWMEIRGLHRREKFVSTFDGKEWPAGWYIERKGKFHYVEANKFYMTGFRGIRRLSRDLAVLMEAQRV